MLPPSAHMAINAALQPAIRPSAPKGTAPVAAACTKPRQRRRRKETSPQSRAVCDDMLAAARDEIFSDPREYTRGASRKAGDPALDA